MAASRSVWASRGTAAPVFGVGIVPDQLVMLPLRWTTTTVGDDATDSQGPACLSTSGLRYGDGAGFLNFAIALVC